MNLRSKRRNALIKNIGISLLIALRIQPAFAQYNETIRSARPGKSFGPYTTGKQIFQFQTGVNFSQFQSSEVSDEGNGFFYLMSMRYGITESVEVRTAFKIDHDRSSIGGEKSTRSGLSALVVGLRFNILDNTGTNKPSLGFQANVNLNTLSTDFNPANPEPAFLLLHSQKISKWLGLTTNWGVAWNGDNADPSGIYTVKLSFPVIKKLSPFFESYGTLKNSDLNVYFDTGIGYLITRDLLVDLSVGFGKNDSLTDFFTDFGVSWRTGKK